MSLLLAMILLCGTSTIRPSLAAAGEKAAGDDATTKAHEVAKDDVLLEALLTELDRSKDHLKMDQVKAPYYIEYRVEDVENCDVETAFGALLGGQRQRLRVLRVVVRIGDYKLDSFYGQGMGGATIIPLDDDPIALRRQIWLLTDEAYKTAADAYAEKLSALKQFTADPNPVDDFARAPVVSSVGPTVKLKVDEAAWSNTLQDVSNLYRQYTEVQSVTASARFFSVNEYFVNSEGTIARNGRTTATVTLGGATQAADGMRLSRNPFWTEERPEELPAHDALMKEAKQMLGTLKALREAPIVEES